MNKKPDPKQLFSTCNKSDIRDTVDDRINRNDVLSQDELDKLFDTPEGDANGKTAFKIIGDPSRFIGGPFTLLTDLIIQKLHEEYLKRKEEYLNKCHQELAQIIIHDLDSSDTIDIDLDFLERYENTIEDQPEDATDN